MVIEGLMGFEGFGSDSGQIVVRPPRRQGRRLGGEGILDGSRVVRGRCVLEDRREPGQGDGAGGIQLGFADAGPAS